MMTIARPYARALFELASEQKKVEAYFEALNLLAQVAVEEESQRVLTAPALSSERKAAWFLSLVGDHLDQTMKNFVHVLALNDRLIFLPEMNACYQRLMNDAQDILQADVQSAQVLNQEERSQLEAALVQRFQQAVKVNYQQDPALIGGVVIYADGVVIDGSIRGRLRRLSQTLVG